MPCRFCGITLPMAVAGLIALTNLSVQGSWNEFLHPLISAPSGSTIGTLLLALRQTAQVIGGGR